MEKQICYLLLSTKISIHMLVLEKGFSFEKRYFNELKRSMDYLALKKEILFFWVKQLKYAGTAMTNTSI
jgi:hypothetical protein